MNTEITLSRGVEEFPNPFKVANFFHWATVFVVAGTGMWLGVEATSVDIADPTTNTVKMLATVFLLMVATLHGAWALKHSHFAIAPENIGLLGGAHPDTPLNFVERLIHSGVPSKDPPQTALANFLYKKVPNLRYAPDVIRVYAFLHWLRSLLGAATLVSFVAAMALTWGQPGQGVIALIYFLFISFRIVRPTTGIMRLVRGRLDMPNQEYFSGVQSGGTLILVALALAPLIARMVLRVFGAKLESFDIAPVLTPAFCLVLLLVSLMIGALSFLALIKQTSGMAATRARIDEKTMGMFQADVQLPFARLDSWLRSHLGEQSSYKLPTRQLLRTDPQLDRQIASGSFNGSRVEESVPRASFGEAGDSYADSFRNALRSDRHRPLVMLDGLGFVLIVAMVAMIFVLVNGIVDSKTGFITTYIIFILGLFAAAEHAFSAAHQLWMRFEFFSEVVSVKFDGSYSNDKQVLRDQTAAGVGILHLGNEYVSMHTAVRSASLKVSYFTVKSVCFEIDGTRHPMEISSRSDANKEILEIFERAFEEYKAGRESMLRDEVHVKAAYDGVPPKYSVSADFDDRTAAATITPFISTDQKTNGDN